MAEESRAMGKSDWISIDVDGDAVRAHLTLPAPSAANGCGVVMMHGSSGIEPGFFVFPERLAELGYATIMPDMFHRVPNFMQLDPIPRVHALSLDGALSDVGAALAALRAHGVKNAAVLGYCFGGSLTMPAVDRLDFAAGIMYYPFEPFVAFGTGTVVPADSVPRIRVPMLGHFGADDKNPSPAERERLDAEMTSAGVKHELHSYEGCPHGFAVKNEGRPNFREAQAKVANDRTIDWLKETLWQRQANKTTA